MLCAMGILLALLERNRSGQGQVVDAAMVDGAAHLSTFFHGLLANGLTTLDIGTNILDSGAPYYQAYETADGQFMAVGAIESRFYKELIKGLELDPASLPDQNDREKWPALQDRFAQIFKSKTRREWEAVFKGKDACVSPVLTLDEVDQHRHNRDRNLFIELDGYNQPGPAPRLSRTPGRPGRPANPRGSETKDVLKELGCSSKEIETLYRDEIVE
jgi:alpha-methylacyl-CoA racemase